MQYDRGQEIGDREIRGAGKGLAWLSLINAIREHRDLELVGEKGLPTTGSVNSIIKRSREYSFINDCLKERLGQLHTFRLQHMSEQD
jgi:hypothetical protein